MNTTLEKFGYPRRLVVETEHWAALLRPQQATLGALVLGSKSGHQAFSQLSSAAFTDLGHICQSLERCLGAAFAYEKINYLMLMMVDPHVHFHVLPRYARSITFGGRRFGDPAWPGPPDLSTGVSLDADLSLADALLAELRRHL